MLILPPTLFVRLRQERAADRIGRHLFSTHKNWTEDAAIIYLNMEAERLKAERIAVDGVDIGVLSVLEFPSVMLTSSQISKNSITARSRCTCTSTHSSSRTSV
jgi:hypothetical protein